GVRAKRAGDDWAGGRSAPYVVMAALHRAAPPLEPMRQFVRQRGRAMASAGASDSNRQVALAFAPIERHQETKQPCNLIDEAARLRMLHHVFPHAAVGAVERP